MNVDPGQSAAFDVTFAPVSEGQKQATLVLNSNDADNGRLEVPLSGSGVKKLMPKIDIDRPQVTFPTTQVGLKATELLTIENTGGVDLEISATALSGSGSAVFIVRDGGSMVIAPGASRQISIEFQPTQPSPYAATLTVSSNDPDVPEYPVLLAALGSGREDTDIGVDR